MTVSSDINSRGTTAGDLLLFNGASFVRLPRGEPGQQMIVRSDGTVAYIPLPEVHLSAWTTKGPTEDCTADFNTALGVANERGAVLVVSGERTLTGIVEALNSSSKEWAMRGGGNGAVIVDKNTTGPCLRFKLTGENRHGVINWRDITIKTLAEKPSQNVVEWIGLKTAQFRLTNVVWEDELETVHLFKSALFAENITEGKFDGCKWRFLRGHDFWITNPSFNGGNIEFSSCQSQECRNGGYIDGLETTNNILFNNFKWTGNTTGTSKQFYEVRTTSLPTAGATTIQLATGLEASYFPPNAAVVLVSFAGMEVVHAAATAEPYNASTGVLTLRDEVAKEHTGHADMRVICCRWSIITGFFTPNLTFLNSHQEARPALHVDGSGTYINTEISADRLKTNTLPIKLVFIAGTSAGEWKFNNNTYQHVNGEETEYAMVYGMCPAGATASLASVDIDGVTTYPAGLASQEAILWKPLGWDGNFGTFARRRVRTSNHGVELNTFPGDASFHSIKILTGATASAAQNADILPCEPPAGSDQEITLNPIPGKTITIVRVGTSTHNVILKTGAEGGKFINGATETTTLTLTPAMPSVTVSYLSEPKKWYVTTGATSSQLPAEHGRSAAMVSGEITIAAPATTATGPIIISAEGGIPTVGALSVIERTPGTGFKVGSTLITGTARVNWVVYTA